MKTTYRLCSFGMLLTVGLWACQDQVVAPDVQPSFAKGGNSGKPPPPEDPPFEPWIVGFTHPDLDPDPIRDVWPWIDPLFTLDISADFQPLDARINDAGLLEFESQSYSLSLHYGDELANMEVPGGTWCWSDICSTPGKCSGTSEFNVLQDLQYISETNSGLTGRLEGIAGEPGFNFYTTVDNAGDLNGHYWIETCWGKCNAVDTGTYTGLEGEFAVYDGFDFWRALNGPIKVHRKDLNSTKKLWTDLTVCGDFAAGSPYRYGAYEVLGMPVGG